MIFRPFRERLKTERRRLSPALLLSIPLARDGRLSAPSPRLRGTLAVSIPLSAEAVLNREFFELRARVLELAASLDRLDRAHGDVAADPRMEKLKRGIELLLSPDADRAERVQLLFSRPYNEDWPTALQVPNARRG